MYILAFFQVDSWTINRAFQLFDRDYIPASRPIRQSVSTPREIFEMFDSITYHKVRIMSLKGFVLLVISQVEGVVTRHGMIFYLT